MSTEHQKAAKTMGRAPSHSDVSFEESDIKVGTIYWYLVALGLATVAALIICVFILRFTYNLAASSDAPPPPSRAALGKDFPPEPRLQGVPGHEFDPQKDLRAKLKADIEANEKLEWIDRNAGIAQIPVEDAMKIIAEKGLPRASASSAEKKK
ncbi:MAG TPA: hypothetical protein VNB49_13580 [Candidatus Dormibacteraeota bacterium]|nr:hypothetical protein [Candidatus Dormibacteraeota bacterium]